MSLMDEKKSWAWYSAIIMTMRNMGMFISKSLLVNSQRKINLTFSESTLSLIAKIYIRMFKRLLFSLYELYTSYYRFSNTIIRWKTCFFLPFRYISRAWYLCSRSSVGLERLPAKEEVTGSSPVGCTIWKIENSFERMGFLFLDILPLSHFLLYWLPIYTLII